MSIPENIKNLANKVRTAIYGKDVRESIAKSMEETGNIADEAKNTASDAYDITQNLLDESFDTSVINQNFEQRLDNEISNLQPEWTGFKDGVTAQLAQRELEILELENNKADQFYVDIELDDKATKAELNDIGIHQINKNKGLIDETYLSDTLKQQMAGNTPIHSIPADKSITQDKMAFPTLEGRASKNLFDKSKYEKDYYIHADTGELLSMPDYFVSEYIPVLESANYYLYTKSGARVAFYTVDKTFISYIDASGVVTTPAGTVYIRFSTTFATIDSIQLEKGDSYTGYESFGVTLNENVILNDSIRGSILKPFSVDVTKIKETLLSRNIFNKENVEEGYYVQSPNGVLAINPEYVASDFIEIKANAEYTRNVVDQLAFYDLNKSYISGLTYGASKNFTTPSNAKYIRVSVPKDRLEIYQLELGNINTEYQSFGYRLKNLIIDDKLSNYEPFITLNDAWTAWLNGEKFPIAFYGDSTTDGANTTGWTENTIGTDHTPPNAYSKKLENLLREVTKNNILRIYNAGFSGRTAINGVSYFEQEFTGSVPYADVKMIGIGFGINDRTLYSTEKGYRDGFKENIKTIIEKCYKNGIQPFLLTTQATIEPGVWTIYEGSYPLRTSSHIESVANEVKKELALEYSLELINITEFTERFIKYSSHSAKTIVSDRLHFGDIGHQYEAEMLFSHIVPLVNWIDSYTKIDYSTQKIVSSIPEDKLTLPDTITDEFKVYANYTKEDSVDTKILDVYIFIDAKKQVTIKAHKNTIESMTYIKVNGVVTTLTDLETVISNLDLGLYHLEVFSGASNLVDFKGFTLN